MSQRWSTMVAALVLLAACGSEGSDSGLGDPDVEVTAWPSTATPSPDGETPTPFPLIKVEAAYVGVSGAYPYVVFFEDDLSCAQLMREEGAAPLPAEYTSILVLVGGWEEGEYPIVDLLTTGGPYEMDGHAVGYIATRTDYGISFLQYARSGAVVVDQISEALSTVKGSFDLHFDSGAIAGEFTIREYCDMY